jgi:MarR family 2-MHQ and catechol resistance regulon transcriptional repressor
MNQRLTKNVILDRDRYGADLRASLKLWVVLARCYNTCAQTEAAAIKNYDLTAPQFGVLEALAHLGPMKMCDIAQKYLTSGANITGVVDRLQEKGLVQRVMEEDDRRTYRIHLTENGGKLIAEIFPLHARTIVAMTETLSASEKTVLIKLLKKLGKSIQAARSAQG